jgi:hypothetical protein
MLAYYIRYGTLIAHVVGNQFLLVVRNDYPSNLTTWANPYSPRKKDKT